MNQAPRPTRELWDSILKQITEVKGRVKGLKEACCMPARHCMFDDLVSYIGDVEADMKNGEPHALIGEIQRKAVRSGEVLGKLAVTCCTNQRNEAYSECVRLLRQILFTSFLFSEETRSEQYFPNTNVL